MACFSPDADAMRTLIDAGVLDDVFGYSKLNISPYESAARPVESLETTPTDSSDEKDKQESEVRNREKRPSRRRTFTNRLKERAASIKSELSSIKKDKRASEPSSRRGSVPEGVSISTPEIITSSPAEATSPTLSSPLPIFPSPTVSSTHVAANLLRPAQHITMASRQSASLLDPAAITRHQQLTAQKARTTKIARDEEAFIRERMRKKGTEHLFPKYRFVDFIGKGTYGRVFQA